MFLHRRAAPGLALIPVLALTSCGWLVGTNCLDYAAPGLLVFVVDSITGVPVVTENEVVATDGSYADTSAAVDFGPGTPVEAARLASERPGTYRVEAAADGYRSWAKEGISVTEGECHVQTVELEALLQPLEDL